MRRGRDELVLEAVELEQAFVLGGQLPGDAGERVGLLLQECGAPARVLAEALDHQAGDGGDGRDYQRSAPARRRIGRGANECERYGLRRPHRDEDRGELSTPGGEGEPENRQQEEPAEAR